MYLRKIYRLKRELLLKVGIKRQNAWKQMTTATNDNEDSKSKKNALADLTDINSVTHTFVRSSALNILARFPETEVVKAMDDQLKPVLSVVEEDGGDVKDEMPGTVASSHVPVSTWSSTGDINVISKSNKTMKQNSKSKSVEMLKKEKDETKKTKKQSGKWFSRLRGKKESEKKKTKKPEKQKPSLQKSQSFGPRSSSTNSQFNRMDSFRKIFKRQNDSTNASEDTKVSGNLNRKDISSPILKSELKSKNLVDRDVIIRKRAYQFDKKTITRDKNKTNDDITTNAKVVEKNTEICNHLDGIEKNYDDNDNTDRVSSGSEDKSSLNSNDKFTTNDLNQNNGKLDVSVAVKDNSKVDEAVEGPDLENDDNSCHKGSPVPPLRSKHLEKKRLSMSIIDDSLVDVLDGNLQDETCEAKQDISNRKSTIKGETNDNEDSNDIDCTDTEDSRGKDHNEKEDYNEKEESDKNQESYGNEQQHTNDIEHSSEDEDTNEEEENRNKKESYDNQGSSEAEHILCQSQKNETITDSSLTKETEFVVNVGDDISSVKNIHEKEMNLDHASIDRTKPTESLDDNINSAPLHDSSLMSDPSSDDKNYLLIQSEETIAEPDSTSLSKSEREDDDVFYDATSDEKVSFIHRKQSLPVSSSGAPLPLAERGTNDLNANVTRWNSDVSSSDSQSAVTSKKKPNSFAGARSTSSAFVPTNQSAVRSPTERSNKRSSLFRNASQTYQTTEPKSLITDVVPVTFPNFDTDRRSQIVLELFTTERTYVRSLETIIELFKKPMLLKKDRDVDNIFSNIDEIFAINKDLLFLLWSKVKHWSNEECIAHIFIDMEERLKTYAVYCKNFDNSDATIKQKIKKNRDFERFLKLCYEDPLCQPGLDLPAYLITIVQRIPRYLLLLKDLFKKTSIEHPDYNNLQTALTRMNKVAHYINSQLQEVHSRKALQELRSTVLGLRAYEIKGRTLLKEAEVCLMSPDKSYKCLLFNDIMVFAIQQGSNRSEIEMTLELKTLWFEDLKKLDPQTNKHDAIELYTPHRPYTMYTSSRMEKRVWIQKMRTAIVTLLHGADCDDQDETLDISRRKADNTYIDGSVYCGEYMNGKRHGHGVMVWPNRTRYIGAWEDDERHGQGELIYYTGEKYVGNWVADKKEGKGRQVYVNNDVYEGEWKDGKMHGKGVIRYANGDCYNGEMRMNEVEGYGEMTCSSGLIYKGDWKKSKRHGSGHLFLSNGNEYEGEMFNDRICGSGSMTYFNGDKYTGDWVNEERHGSGVLTLVNGTVYDGQWAYDFMNGLGKMTYPNGDEYSGTWYENRRIGLGVLTYAHGDVYDGHWHDDTMHGKGVMNYKDGSVYEGEWKNGKRDGRGVTNYKDKSIYEGEYHLGFRHGQGKLLYSNNVCYHGGWRWDKFDGNGRYSDPNNDYMYTGDWSKGMREGSGIETSFGDRYEGSWKADMKHGAGVETSYAGHVFTGMWKENRKHGEGQRKMRSNVEEVQRWYEGHLVEGVETIAQDLPPLPRR
ncbi:uncharacterized protein LOC124451915 isoform X3 [Xenia sp. Carnegie-2017]|uniref:uncharacterized protein LOC124451915 isoform X3 n=1 Tax=Xenia sp. Carnegie-2017 TaxID=2897299 RepID=UPI001F040A1F|nr:uncharacterized protein LOC124451915 isoform X3 [Xenia sp. Carnegie-2017]